MRAMMMGVVLVVATAFSWAGDESRLRDEKGSRYLRHRGVVDAPIAEVWRLFTTSEGVVKAWSVGKAEADLRMGGRYRTAYDPNAELGGPGTIINTVLAYEPERMIAFRPTAPETAPECVRKFCETGWTVFTFDRVDEAHTRVCVASVGYGDGPLYDEAYAFFDRGNAWTLKKMQETLAKPGAAEAGEKAMAGVRRLAGKEWIFEKHRPDGTVLRVRNVIELGPDGKSVTGKGWLGDERGMVFHSSSSIWREPETGEVRFQSIEQDGAIARGAIAPLGENGVEWSWTEAAADGKQRRFVVEQTFADDDHYRMIVSRVAPDGARSTMVDLALTRVEQAPPEFRTLRAEK